MSAFDPDLACADVLRLIEAAQLSGSWSWRFAPERQSWSPGLFHLLGLDPLAVPPGYDLLARLVHPEDQGALASAAELRQGFALPDAQVRVVRPDGSVRRLGLRTEIRLAPGGRPVGAVGLVLDVTDPHALAEARRAAQRQRSALFLQAGVILVPVTPDLRFDFPPEAAARTGRSLSDVNADPFAEVAAAERDEFRARAVHHHGEGTLFQARPLFHLRDPGPLRFRVVSAPVRDEGGRITGWHCLMAPLGAPSPPAAGPFRRGLEQALRGRHLRAARGLLDWSREDLARASGLSLSTVRRLEDEAEPDGTRQPVTRSHHGAVAALRQAGIRFIALDDGTIALAKGREVAEG
ncbi:PAS domain-containing protein [Methylobacterium sp. EM32]|uniref:PAS domain-containing protein n=1 Tax=Methylobacterium sp. EM32 TaxID=3163481 RepID=UPI0033A6D5B0